MLSELLGNTGHNNGTDLMVSISYNAGYLETSSKISKCFKKIFFGPYSCIFQYFSFCHLIKKRIIKYVSVQTFSLLGVLRKMSKNSGDLGSGFIGYQSVTETANTLDDQYGSVRAVAGGIRTKKSI